MTRNALTAGCGCGKKRVYEVTKRDGSKTTVASLNEAMTMIRQHGGTYRVVQAA